MVRPKVLISAFACNPKKGSEPGLGYHYIRALTEHCDLTVITESFRNEADIEAEREIDPGLTKVTFHYIPWPSVTSDGGPNDGVNPFRYYELYRRWQLRAFELARRITKNARFDLVHHLTMTGYREPGYLWQLDVPFVWGPVGGYVMMPWRYLFSLGWRSASRHLLRNVINWVQMRTSRRVRQATARADAIFASTSVDLKRISQLYQRVPVLLGENAAGPVHDVKVIRRSKGEVLRIGWSGLHIARKALPLLLHAISSLPEYVRIELHIAGDGDQSHRWKRLAERLGLSITCQFHGWLPREQATDLMRSMDVFVVTSVQDATTAVVFEALASGLPVICHASCGFVDVIDDSCGILVPMVSPRASHLGFARALKQLFDDPDTLVRLSYGAMARAELLSWKHRAAVILEAYSAVIDRYSDSPR